jgi:hypothetical protein
MSGVFGWLIYFAGILALFYLVVLLAAPRKWLFSLLLLIYGIAMIFIADEVRAEYGSSNVAYVILDASAGMAIALVILLPLVEGVLRLGTIPFLDDGRARSKIADAVYWFAAGLSIPLVLLYWRVFARCSGTVLIPALLATAIVAFTVFFAMRRRDLSGNPLLLFLITH